MRLVVEVVNTEAERSDQNDFLIYDSEEGVTYFYDTMWKDRYGCYYMYPEEAFWHLLENELDKYGVGNAWEEQ